MTTTRGIISALSVTAVIATATLGAGALAPAPARALPGIAAPSGVDVAGHQHPGGGDINWTQVRGDGQSFAFVKATEGSDFVNPHYAEDVRQASASGLKVGAYHYGLPSDDPVRQARHFAGKVNQLPANSLPPVLDLEVAEGKSPRQLIEWTRLFLNETERLTGKKPMMYTYRFFWSDHMANTKEFSQYPLWLAAYQSTAPKPVGGWSKLAFWQRSETGRVKGIASPVDMNLFNGNGGQLHTFNANSNNYGGMLNGLVLPSNGLDVLGKDAGLLIGAILAVAATGAAAPGLIQAAEKAGIDASGARELQHRVEKLVKSGNLPEEDLKKMAQGDYNIGDLLILLDNAEHLSGNVKQQDVQQLRKVSQLLRLFR